jgi:hypothetical protein
MNTNDYMTHLLELSKTNDEVREQLQRSHIKALRDMALLHANYLAISKGMKESADTIDKAGPGYFSPATCEALRGAAHLLCIVVASLETPIQRLRDELDQLGTPQ